MRKNTLLKKQPARSPSGSLAHGLALALWGLALVPALTLAQTADPFSTGALVGKTQADSVSRPLMTAPCDFADPAASALSLVDVVERALCNNPQTREAWANAKAQAAQVGVGQSAYLPTLSATAGLSRNETNGAAGRSAGSETTEYSQRNGMLSLSYLLYDFGARAAALENAKQLLAALNATQDATLQSVFLSAVQAYYQLFATRAAVDSAKEAEKSSLESFRAATARYTVGAATPADKLQAQTAYSQSVLNRIQAEGAARNAQGALANSMGLDANQPLDILPPPKGAPDREFDSNIALLIEAARKQRPDLAAAEAQVRAAQANAQAVKASGMPSVSLSASSSYTDTSIGDPLRSSALGVSVSVPLFTGFNTTYRVRAAEAQADARIAQRDRINRQVALDVWTTYHALVTGTQALRSSADLLDSATQSERVASGRYKAGVGTILDLLTAQSALASARQQNIQALFNWYIAKAALAQAMGQLGFPVLESGAPRSEAR